MFFGPALVGRIGEFGLEEPGELGYDPVVMTSSFSFKLGDREPPLMRTFVSSRPGGVLDVRGAGIQGGRKKKVYLLYAFQLFK